MVPPRALLAALLILVAASALEAQTPVYRSIGVTGGTLYSTGTATVALSATTVNFGGGACLPANVGQRDVVTFTGAPAETLYILSRNSSSQVTIQTAATVAHTGQTYTITRAYNTLQAWETGQQGNLEAGDRVEVGVLTTTGLSSPVSPSTAPPPMRPAS